MASSSSAAALDVLGLLPAPASASNRGAADLLEGGELVAYGAASTVAVVEVATLQVACMLQGGHRGATVTAVKWGPHDGAHGAPFKQAAGAAASAGGPMASRASPSHHSHHHHHPPLRLASGDSAGGVVVWDAASGAAAARLDDAPAAQELLDGYAAAARGDCCVTGLAWVLPGRGALAAVIAPALLVVWDPGAPSAGGGGGGGLLWKRELAAPTSPETFTSIAVDPLDRRRAVLCGDAGALVVMRLRGVGDGGSGGDVEQRQYRVNVSVNNNNNKQQLSSQSSQSQGQLQQQSQQSSGQQPSSGRDTPAGETRQPRTLPPHKTLGCCFFIIVVVVAKYPQLTHLSFNNTHIPINDHKLQLPQPQPTQTRPPRRSPSRPASAPPGASWSSCCLGSSSSSTSTSAAPPPRRPCRRPARRSRRCSGRSGRGSRTGWGTTAGWTTFTAPTRTARCRAGRAAPAS